MTPLIRSSVPPVPKLGNTWTNRGGVLISLLLYRQAAQAQFEKPMRILSITSVYPTPADPGRGLFVRARLQGMSKAADVKLIVPVWRPPVGRSPRIPPRWNDGPVEVFHPGWLYLRGSGA